MYVQVCVKSPSCIQLGDPAARIHIFLKVFFFFILWYIFVWVVASHWQSVSYLVSTECAKLLSSGDSVPTSWHFSLLFCLLILPICATSSCKWLAPKLCMALIREFVWLKNNFHVVSVLAKSVQTYCVDIKNAYRCRLEGIIGAVSCLTSMAAVCLMSEGSIWQLCSWEGIQRHCLSVQGWG